MPTVHAPDCTASGIAYRPHIVEPGTLCSLAGRRLPRRCQTLLLLLVIWLLAGRGVSKSIVVVFLFLGLCLPFLSFCLLLILLLVLVTVTAGDCVAVVIFLREFAFPMWDVCSF